MPRYKLLTKISIKKKQRREEKRKISVNKQINLFFFTFFYQRISRYTKCFSPLILPPFQSENQYRFPDNEIYLTRFQRKIMIRLFWLFFLFFLFLFFFFVRFSRDISISYNKKDSKKKLSKTVLQLMCIDFAADTHTHTHTHTHSYWFLYLIAHQPHWVI